MSKKLVEEKALNSILKAIEIHLNLMDSKDIIITNGVTKEKIEKSLETLKQTLNEFINPQSQMKQISRKRFQIYIQAKKSFEEALKTGDRELIRKCEEKKNYCLKEYLEIKKIVEELKD